MIRNKAESFEPERRDLIQDRAFTGNWIIEDDVERREPISRDEEERVAEIKNFADFAAAQSGEAGQFDVAQRKHDESGKQESRKKPQEISCFPPFLIHNSSSHGRPRRQTSRADPSRTRLGFHGRSAEG